MSIGSQSPKGWPVVHAYAVGEPVVFGTYGATLVRAVHRSEQAGRTWTHVLLGFPFDASEPSSIINPLAEHQDLAPLSEVLGPHGVPGVLAVLSEPVPEEEPRTWGSARETYFTMIGGTTPDADLDEMPPVLDARAVARAVRDLTVRGWREPLDPHFTQLLDLGRSVLVSELALGAGWDRAAAQAAIDQALAVHQAG